MAVDVVSQIFMTTGLFFSQDLEGEIAVLQSGPGPHPEGEDHLRAPCIADVAQVDDVPPPELLQQGRGLLLGPGVVPAQEHGRLAPGYPRVDHDLVAYDIEGLDDMRARQRLLYLFAERIGIAYKQRGAASPAKNRGGWSHR